MKKESENAFIWIVVGLGTVSLVCLIALCLAMWSAWWMHPVWHLVLVPLGAPRIDYWHFMAVVMFIGSMRGARSSRYVKDEYIDKWHGYADWIIWALIGPPLVYGVSLWLMSGR